MIVDGDCFKVALELAAITAGKVVHGAPIGRGPLNEGKRYMHAWVEKNGLVLDRANRRNIRLPIAVYYRKGRMDASHVVKYTFNEAMTLAEDSGHYGPWDKDLIAQKEIG